MVQELSGCELYTVCFSAFYRKNMINVVGHISVSIVLLSLVSFRQ